MRKKVMIAAWILAGLLAVAAGALALSPFRFSTGIYIAADSPLILMDGGSGEPVVMLGRTGDFRTGDHVLILHNGTMMLSYPAQMNVYFCIRLKKGDASEVPEEALKTLEEMGWLEEKTFGQTQ